METVSVFILTVMLKSMFPVRPLDECIQDREIKKWEKIYTEH